MEGLASESLRLKYERRKMRYSHHRMQAAMSMLHNYKSEPTSQTSHRRCRMPNPLKSDFKNLGRSKSTREKGWLLQVLFQVHQISCRVLLPCASATQLRMRPSMADYTRTRTRTGVEVAKCRMFRWKWFDGNAVMEIEL